MTQAIFYEPARAGKIGQFCPIRRCAFADEMPRVVLFLESDEASYVTGQAWAACGGLSSGLPYKLGAMA
jgi:NAD(P)-dependent dehydrogenase (short-subunit alcohol dehydrogenase family)